MAAGRGAGRGARPCGGRQTDKPRSAVALYSLRSRTIWKSPAIALTPVIADVLSECCWAFGMLLARMSGSGATCFGLFSSAAAARAAGKVLRDKYQHWWVKAGVLGRDRMEGGFAR